MAPRTPACRSAAALLAGLLLAISLPAGEAGAQSGNGLYEPFPEAAVKKRAHRYLEQLGARTPEVGIRFSDAELATGVFVRSSAEAPQLEPAPAARLAASGRARGGGPDAAPGLQLLLLAAALAVPATALASRARARAG